jgi:hypothetical protein
MRAERKEGQQARERQRAHRLAAGVGACASRHVSLTRPSEQGARRLLVLKGAVLPNLTLPEAISTFGK